MVVREVRAGECINPTLDCSKEERRVASSYVPSVDVEDEEVGNKLLGDLAALPRVPRES